MNVTNTKIQCAKITKFHEIIKYYKCHFAKKINNDNAAICQYIIQTLTYFYFFVWLFFFNFVKSVINVQRDVDFICKDYPNLKCFR